MKLLMITRKVDQHDALAGFTYRWVRAFASEVSELHVMCLEMGDTSGLPSNCSVYSLGKEHGKNRIREFIRFHALAARLVPKVDGIFTHQNPEYGILIAPWAKLYRRKLVAWYTHSAVTWRLRLLVMLVDAIVTASAESFRLKTRKLVVLSHGIETDLFVPREHEDHSYKKILTVSRISPSKNIDLMIELVLRLKKETSHHVRLDIVGSPVRTGDKEYLDALRKQVAAAGLQSEVSFVGAVPYPELPKRYPEADLFLNFSDTGSLDKAVLEAMSCGVPVLTTNEAFKPLSEQLDACSYVQKGSHAVVQRADALLSESGHEQRARLRDFVMRHHSLKNVVTTIVHMYV